VENKNKVLIRSIVNQIPEMIKKLLKSKVNPTEIKLEITSLKLLTDGRVMIEANSKNEIKALGNKIEKTCGAELEGNIQKRRNPRLVLLSIPEDITLQNAEETLAKQNPEPDIKRGHQSKMLLHYKAGNKNLVTEWILEPETNTGQN